MCVRQQRRKRRQKRHVGFTRRLFHQHIKAGDVAALLCLRLMPFTLPSLGTFVINVFVLLSWRIQITNRVAGQFESSHFPVRWSEHLAQRPIIGWPMRATSINVKGRWGWWPPGLVEIKERKDHKFDFEIERGCVFFQPVLEPSLSRQIQEVKSMSTEWRQ